MIRFLPVLGVLLLTWPSTSHATEAEYQRLHAELDGLAARNHWRGVDRCYRKLVRLDWPLLPSDHLLGAQAARQRGEGLVGFERLEAAVQASAGSLEVEQAAHEAATAELESMLDRYGKVELWVGDQRVAALVRFNMPFSPDAQQSIAEAQKRLAREQAYRGLLPLGEYMIDGERFEVLRSELWQVFRVE